MATTRAWTNSPEAIPRFGLVRLVVCVLLLLALVGCDNPDVVTPTSVPSLAPSPSVPVSPDAYKIGLLVSLTGPYADRGLAAQNAVELAARELNASGGVDGHQVVVVVQDDQGDASQAVTGLKTIANQGAVAVIGPTSDVAAAAVLPLEDEANLPTISLASDPAQFQPTHQFVFSVAPPPGLVAAGLLSYLQRSNIHAIGLLRETSAAGEAARQQLQQLGPQFDVQVLVDETYGISDTDLSRQLGNVKNNPSARALLVWGASGTDAPAAITKQFHDLGLSMPLLLTPNQANMAYLQGAGSAADGAVLLAGKPVLQPYLPSNDPSRQALAAFSAAYKQTTGSQPDAYAAQAYDAFNILVQAITASGAAPDRLAAELEKTHFDGVAGPYAFSSSAHAGLQRAALAMVSVRSGAFVPVQPNCDGCAETIAVHG